MNGETTGGYGMRFFASSPVGIVQNQIKWWDKAGIFCEKTASPAFVDGENGGHNCSVLNDYGVVADYFCNPVLGDIGDAEEPGYNSFAGNTSYQIALYNECDVSSQENYYRDNGPIPSTDFYVESGSTLIYDPYLESDPNSCTGDRNNIALNQTGSGQLDGGRFGLIGDSLVGQARGLRLRGQYAEAITLLKNLIITRHTDVVFLKWALPELLANYQMIRNPRGANLLSVYLRGLQQSQANSQVKHIIRDLLSSSLKQEGN